MSVRREEGRPRSPGLLQSDRDSRLGLKVNAVVRIGDEHRRHQRKVHGCQPAAVTQEPTHRGSSTRASSDVQIRHLQGVLLDELPPRLDCIAHQRGEDVVRRDRVLDAHLHQAARFRVDGRVP